MQPTTVTRTKSVFRGPSPPKSSGGCGVAVCAVECRSLAAVDIVLQLSEYRSPSKPLDNYVAVLAEIHTLPSNRTVNDDALAPFFYIIIVEIT